MVRTAIELPFRIIAAVLLLAFLLLVRLPVELVLVCVLPSGPEEDADGADDSDELWAGVAVATDAMEEVAA